MFYLIFLYRIDLANEGNESNESLSLSTLQL